MRYLLVALGSALGGMARMGLAEAMAAWLGARFPWGTLLINVMGSALIGFVATTGLPIGRWALPVEARVFLMVGVCGGFTTFSSFSLQTVELFQRGAVGPALFYVAASVALCLLGAWLGLMLGRA